MFFQMGLYLFLAAACALPRPSYGEDQKSDDSAILPESYAGVVTNQTVTVAGQEFYQNFITAWRDKELSDRYTLSVHERPTARWGSQLWIEFAQRRVFQTNLSTSRSAIKTASERAVEIAYQNIVDADVQRLLFREIDLAVDEF
jgi:curli production assembly/transport component CsgE